MTRSADTIAALATPVGTAALALVRVSGPDTSRLAREIGGSAPPLRVARHVDYRDRAGQLLDGVLLTFFAAPKSYTGEDALEVSCHGNPFIAQKILGDLLARGCRPAEPGEFTQRAFLNGRMDLSQAEAVMDLIHARSERALAAANQQLRGSLGRRMSDLIDRLLLVLARIEAYIDFPDEDLPPEDRGWVREEVRRLSEDTGRLLATSHYGQLLRDGIRVVIVGEPNVGKSSLLNRLVGRDRALVSPEPGTTRDFIEERILVGPHCIRLIDTAGLNPSPAPLERLGMGKTREMMAEADVLLLVFDGSADNRHDFRIVDGAVPCIFILNKNDLRQYVASSPAPTAGNVVRVSAQTGEGINELLGLIHEQADALQAQLGPDAVAINERHAHTLKAATEALQAAAVRIDTAGEVELLASELRAALSAYGEITGKVDNERMLDRLFATFCIGK